MKKFELNELKGLNLDGHLVVDTRSPEKFLDGFIKGSVSIPFDEQFLHTLQELVEDDMPVIFIPDIADESAVVRAAKGTGLNNLAGWLHGGFDAWQNNGGKIDMLIGIDTDEFAIDYQFDEFYLVDVRSKEEFATEHVEDAENLPLTDLESFLAELDIEQSYYLYGNTPAEATTAASLFKKNGFSRVRVVNATYEQIKLSGVSIFVQKQKEKSAPRLPGADPR
jgi:rhodanese-related sulfurtransferase